jgi:hypothetical protein
MPVKRFFAYSSEAQTRRSLSFSPNGFSAFANAFPILLPARVNRKGLACSSSCGRLGVFMIAGMLRVYTSFFI